VADAVGYLALWAAPSGTYPAVVINVGQHGDLWATYWKDPKVLTTPDGSRPGYAIMGQRCQKTGTYSFHS